jgi:hypothetical protein
MTRTEMKSRFNETLRRPVLAAGEAQWAFVVLPREASATLPRRGRTTVHGSLNGHPFRATLEPDGRLSHWLRVSADLLQTTGAGMGELVTVEIVPVDQEPEPEMPIDLQQALAAAPDAQAVWQDITPVARLDWIHWVTSAKQAKTRVLRVGKLCDMLVSGKRRVCCFDPSGHYSKAFSAPKEAD